MRPMTRPWIVPTLALILSACSGATLHGAPKVPDYARTCSAQAARGACLPELQRAAELGDRARTGQLLLLAARGAPDADRRDIVRAALWLAPDAWLPDDLRALMDSDDLAVIGPSKGARAKVGRGTILRLRGGLQPPASVPRSEVELGIPAGSGPLAGDSLAGLIASAAGADAAAWGAGGAQHLSSGAPLLSRILGTGVGLPPDAWQSARLISQADRALREGQQPQAWLLLGQAVDALPASAPPCTARGELDYLRTTLARISFEGSDTDSLADLRKVCLDTAVPAPETRMQRYLQEVVALQTNLGTAAGELPAPWSTPSRLEAWSRSIDELARELGDRRGDILRALRQDLLARASQPKNRCDELWSARVKVQREAAKQAIRDAGRDDLALPKVETKTEGARVEAVNVDSVLAWAERPENRWLRVPTLAGVLSDPALMLASESNRPRIERLCGTAFDELLHEIKSDRLEGYDGRNVSRWFAASRGIALCRRADAIASLSDELLRGAIEGKQGKIGALKVLMLTGFQALEALLTGRTSDGLVAIKVMKDGLARLSARLGPGDEDRVLDAVIGVVGAAVDRVMSQNGDVAVALERAAATLEPIVRKPINPQAPDLLRAAPGIHLAALALLAAVNANDHDTRGRDAALQRLETSVERDVRQLLAAFGVPGQEPAILRIVKAATAVARAADATPAFDGEALMRDLEAASEPAQTETRWWGVGLNGARLALWDLAAAALVKSESSGGSKAHASSPEADPRIARILDRADQTLIRLVDGAVRDWGNQGTSWEFLYVTPATHRAVAAMVLAPEQAPDLGERVARAMQPGIDAGLSRISSKLRDAKPAEVGFLAVLIDALELAHDQGGVTALADNVEARVKWARRLREQAATYPPEYRVVIDAAAAAAEFDSDRAKARAELQDAARDAADSQFGDVAWLPRLVEAVLLYHDDDTAGALLSVDAVVQSAKAAVPCNKPNEVVGLEPFRAWALERLGRHSDADAALRDYLDATRQFGGDGFIECRLVSYRNAFNFTADLKQRLGSLFFPTSNEGTFQVGAGYGDSRSYDRLTCVSTPISTPRLDLATTGQLMRVAYALRAGDDATANAALLGAISDGRALVHGDVASLGVNDGAAVEDARKNAFVPMIVYVAAAARGRGHLAAADQLDTLAEDIASARGESVAGSLADRPGLPRQLDKLGFDVVSPIIATAWEASDDKAKETGTAAKPGNHGAPSAVPPWSLPLIESYALLRRSKVKQAMASMQRVRAPAGDALARIAVARAKDRMAGAKAPLRSVAEVIADLQELSRAGMFTEVQAVASEQAARLLHAKKKAEALDVLNRALSMIPADRAPLTRADLLVDIGTQVPEVLSHGDWANAMEQVEPSLQGRVALQREVAILQRVLAYEAQQGEPERLLSPLDRLRGVLERALGADHAETLKLALAELLVRSLQTRVEQADVDEMLARIHTAGAGSEALVNVLDAWRATSDRPAERKTVVLRFVQQILAP